MSTRGTIGFVIDGAEKLTYNHSDSYPDWLGVRILAFCREHAGALDELRGRARALRVIDGDVGPSDQDQARFADFWDHDVSTGTDWYSLLRETQGDLDLTLRTGVMIDGGDFPTDSLFCEWAYVVNLDTEMLEVFAGFQHEPHERGRFAARGNPQERAGGQTYYPVAMVAAWPLRELPSENDFLATLASEVEA